MNADRGRAYNWASSSSNDIKLSINDFLRMSDVMRDDRFTPEGLMRWKNMYEITMQTVTANLLLAFPPALLTGYLFSGRVRKSHSGYK